MDTYSPALLRQGLTGMIGKGKRSEAVIEAIRACGAVYFGATGGCGALLSRCIKKRRSSPIQTSARRPCGGCMSRISP